MKPKGKYCRGGFLNQIDTEALELVTAYATKDGNERLMVLRRLQTLQMVLDQFLNVFEEKKKKP